MIYTRRQFMQTSAFWSAGSFIPSFLTRAAFAAAANKPKSDRILVVLQLSGGNDGLNTVVPYADDEYGRNRTTLRLRSAQVHKIDSYLGFHPELKTLWEQFQEGHVSVIHGVGYPKSNRDHAGALRDWHTARPHDENCQTGWIGRTADSMAGTDNSNIPCVLTGNNSQPLALNAERMIIPLIRSINQLKFQYEWESEVSPNNQKSKNPLLDFMKRQKFAAQEKSQRIASISRSKNSNAKYPPFQLAATLRIIAQLIQADVGIRIYYAVLGGDGFGGFDNHANQRDNHAALLRQLSDSVSAFINDLKKERLLDRVLLITVSEFGRTLKENGRHGTGHGAAAPMLVAGGDCHGLFGRHPSLTDLDNGALKYHIDFRNVFATLLDQWLCIDSKDILGAKYKQLSFLPG